MKKKIVTGVAVFVFVAVIAVLAVFASIVNAVNRVPTLLTPGSEWVCSTSGSMSRASFDLDDYPGINGIMCVDGKDVCFSIRYREGYAEFYHPAEELSDDPQADERLLLTASIRARGEALLFRIHEDYLDIGQSTLVFERWR